MLSFVANDRRVKSVPVIFPEARQGSPANNTYGRTVIDPELRWPVETRLRGNGQGSARIFAKAESPAANILAEAAEAMKDFRSYGQGVLMVPQRSIKHRRAEIFSNGFMNK